jgi:cytochrome c oxidase assembly protein subunit 15
MERFQKLALATLVSLFLLIFAGAVVRATGAGLGCPDWPTCWGCLIPPTSLAQVDMEKVDMEKFRRKAASLGRNPEEITKESLKSEFNPVHTWTEYTNRLLATPLAFLSLALFVASFRQKERRPGVFWGAAASLLLVLVNAILGMKVVYSGLKPGIITAHLALALIMLVLLVYVAWGGTDRPWRRLLNEGGGAVRGLGVGLLVLTLVEGVMGAQVRELTDELARSHAGEARAAWTAELEGALFYLVHRSFSWLIVLGTAVFLWRSRRSFASGLGWLEKVIGGLVGSLMVMGLVLSQVGVLPLVQVFHVGAASLLTASLVLWLLATTSSPSVRS